MKHGFVSKPIRATRAGDQGCQCLRGIRVVVGPKTLAEPVPPVAPVPRHPRPGAFGLAAMCALWLLIGSLAGGVESTDKSSNGSSNKRLISFRNEVMPILTRHGCNSGACHGKSTGRGGFQLSLFGFVPESDFDAITRGSRGRRVFPRDPEKSLLLQKAVMAVPHGGGRRFSESDEEYRVLQAWIAAEMPPSFDDESELTELRFEPPEIQTAKDTDNVASRVVALFSDSSQRDVTHLVRFRSGAPTIADVDEDGRIELTGNVGEAPIVAMFLGKVAIGRVFVKGDELSPAAQQRLADMPMRNLIDRHVHAKLVALGIPPTELADDGIFLRRVTLQIAGRTPTMEEVRTFLENPDEHKREELVNQLLASADYADHFAQKWSDLLRNKRRGQKPRVPGTIAFHRWIRNSLARNDPYDRFVREVITATGNVTVNPPSQWYAEVRYLDRYVDDTAQVFLGLRIGCARCHHHPFEDYSQGDYYGLAAFFARVDRKGGAGVAERRANETVYVKPNGEVRHPVTDEVVLPKGLGAERLEVPPYADPRQHLVDWMVSPGNPYFARAFVNRMWAHFFSRGLVEPLDDIRVTNPATIEPLLDDLADEFVRSGYDMQHIIRLICTSATYQLSSDALPENLDDARNHARFYPQRMTAEVLLDSFDGLSKVPTSYSGLPKGTRALQLPDEDYSNEFLKLFGRPKRESACECERTAEPSLSQSIFVMNNGFVLGKATSSKGFATQLAADTRADAEKIDELFLSAFCRRPLPSETQKAVEYIQSESDRKKAYANLLWALMNTKEFMYIH
jgi:hypothetical protein